MRPDDESQNLWSIHPLDEEYNPSRDYSCVCRGRLEDVERWAQAVIPGWSTRVPSRVLSGEVRPLVVLDIGPDAATKYEELHKRAEQLRRELEAIERRMPPGVRAAPRRRP